MHFGIGRRAVPNGFLLYDLTSILFMAVMGHRLNCVQSLNIIISCSEIRQSLVLFMLSSCLISDIFGALTFRLSALVFISVATVQSEPEGVFYLLF